MQTLTPQELTDARRALGHLWGLERSLTYGEFAHILGFAQKSGQDSVMKMEEGRGTISGPVTVLVRMMLAGAEPPTKADALKATRASTSVRGPHREDARHGEAKRPTIRTTWAGDPNRED